MKPILFNTEMVKAILDNRKTQTRRRINNKLQYKKGDILYVRETFCIGTYDEDDSRYKEYWYISQYDDSNTVFYFTDTLDYRYTDPDNETKWKPSIHMPKKYARIFLKITNVRIERLQDISIEDIQSEGFNIDTLTENYGDKELIDKTLEWWIKLWNTSSVNGYMWDDNPFVLVYEFERVEYEI